jgi:Na+/H+-dicarboxylate symporter
MAQHSALRVCFHKGKLGKNNPVRCAPPRPEPLLVGIRGCLAKAALADGVTGGYAAAMDSKAPGQEGGGAAGKRLTRLILLAMVVGGVFGIVLHSISERAGDGSAAALFIDQWLVDGLFSVVGQGFLRLLTVLVVPLVLLSLIGGAAAMDDIRKLGRVGVKSLGLYLGTTAAAITLAMGLTVLIGPGRGFELDSGATFEAREAPPLAEVIIDLFPKNAFAAMSQGNMLQVIVFAILVGIAITLAGDAGKRVLAGVRDLDAVVMKLVGIVMALAPYGVFALIARTFAGEGFAAFGPLLGYFLTVLLALALHCFGVYPALLRVLGGLRIRPFLRKMRQAQLFAFSTASSNATIPVTLHTVENRLGVSNSIASFTVPLGATINMDGTAIMQGVATVFIAQAYGLELGASQLLMVVVTATLASIGTAGVPGVGLVMLSMVLVQAGLPVEGIGLIIGIDRLLDMARTAVNITGDAAVSCVIARSEGELDWETNLDTSN